ncbi:auxin-responsive protein SAUR40-like [Lolium perenne]|uniref:auxin-responsive protein SAUR40-like n=1 Tax=Lolium perenne TaxID=4522 RepID=UPI0021F5512D|nr:auxin-responsive protein SAUR71-like [Lolium perenne]
MALAVWRSKNSTTEAAVQSRYFVLAGAVNGGRTPKGYVPIVLVGGGDEGCAEERVLVHVAMLKEPCMEGLLEMAAQQFGYGQQGVLRIPCDARQFHQMMVTVHGKSRS